MPEMEQQELNKKLEQFSEMLRKRIKEFHDTGRFADLQRPFLADIEQKNDALRAKVSSAVQSRNSWTFAKAELWRDYEAMINEFVTLEDSAGADARKKA
jgi:hypothetical protein